MANAEGKVPVRESVGAALAVFRANIVTVAVIALVAAALTTLITVLADIAPLLGIFLAVANWVVTAFAYTALLSLALPSGLTPAQAARTHGVRVLGAMLVLGFFMFIVSVVLFLVAMAIFVAASVNYSAQIEAAGQDQEAVQAVFAQVFQENPALLIVMILVFVLPWLWLTSRLYLAAPATYESGRIRVFDTWAWTKGNVLRIMAARLMLLLPASILSSALSLIVVAAIGGRITDMLSVLTLMSSNPIAIFAGALFQFALISGLEAPLSAYLMRGLKPAQESPAQTFS